MKIARIALPGLFAIFGLGLIAVMVALIGFGAVSLSVTSSSNDEDTATTAQAVCTPGDSDDASVSIPSEYEQLIEDAAAESGFSPDVLAAQTYAESGWDETAESEADARGINQFRDATWEAFGDGGDVWDPEDSFPAQGRYMAYLRDFMEEEADDEEHLLELVLAGYNAGEGAVQDNDFDLEQLYDSGQGYRDETQPYVENITAAAEGNYTSDCDSSGGDVPDGDIVETADHMAWEEQVTLPHSNAADHGRDDAKPEFVDAATDINNDIHTAFFTDCGVYAATVMISGDIDPDFPIRGTSMQLDYLSNHSDYDFFTPQSEGDLEPGDILILDGHIYFYTGQRHSGQDGSAYGASLYTRPPSGHDLYLSDSRGTYNVARYTG